MRDRAFESHFDVGSSTLELYGVIDHSVLPLVMEAVDRAFRSSPCRLTVDLSGVDLLPAHLLGWLVHLCNTQYPGTLIQLPARGAAYMTAADESMPASA